MGDQTWNAAAYESNARFVSDLGMPVVALLDAQPGERILDLGCGDGVLTKKLQDMGCEVLGIDPSPEFIQAASELGLNVSLQDATEMDFDDEFDAVFSNAVLHWIPDADRLIGNVFRALRNGGRFVAECGGHKCVETIRTALIAELEKRGYDGHASDPWYFPTTADYGARLEKAGFRVQYIEFIPRPTPLPGDIRGFLETFGGTFMSALPAEERNAYIDDVRDRIKSALYSNEGTWIADYTRLRFKAHKSD